MCLCVCAHVPGTRGGRSERSPLPPSPGPGALSVGSPDAGRPCVGLAPRRASPLGWMSAACQEGPLDFIHSLNKRLWACQSEFPSPVGLSFLWASAWPLPPLGALLCGEKYISESWGSFPGGTWALVGWFPGWGCFRDSSPCPADLPLLAWLGSRLSAAQSGWDGSVPSGCPQGP